MAQVYVRDFLAGKRAATGLRTASIVGTYAPHDDDYPVLHGLLRIRSGRLYRLDVISPLAVPVW